MSASASQLGISKLITFKVAMKYCSMQLMHAMQTLKSEMIMYGCVEDNVRLHMLDTEMISISKKYFNDMVIHSISNLSQRCSVWYSHVIS